MTDGIKPVGFDDHLTRSVAVEPAAVVETADAVTAVDQPVGEVECTAAAQAPQGVDAFWAVALESIVNELRLEGALEANDYDAFVDKLGDRFAAQLDDPSLLESESASLFRAMIEDDPGIQAVFLDLRVAAGQAIDAP